MSKLELSFKVVEAIAPLGESAARLAEEALHLRGAGQLTTADSVASRLQSLGEFSTPTILADSPGMSQEEFVNRLQTGTWHGTPVRVRELGPTNGLISFHSMNGKRALGQVGSLDSLGSHASPITGHESDVLRVTHENGSVAAYRAAELEPVVVKPDAVKDLPVVEIGASRIFDEAAVGDSFKTRGVPSGRQLDAQPWDGHVDVVHTHHKYEGRLSGEMLYHSDGVRVVGKEINPSEVKVGDKLNLVGLDSLPRGEYRVNQVHGLANGITAMSGRFNVEGADYDDLLLRNTHDMGGNALSEGGLFRVARTDVNSDNFYAMRQLDPKRGDVLAVPHNAHLESPNDLDLRMMRGRTWTVEDAAKNGVVVRNGDTVYALPRNSLTEPFMYNLDDYLKRGA